MRLLLRGPGDSQAEVEAIVDTRYTGAVGEDALIGMALLDGHRLGIDAMSGGAVSVRALTPADPHG